jgi:carboxypeptidase PM20D1
MFYVYLTAGIAFFALVSVMLLRTLTSKEHERAFKLSPPERISDTADSRLSRLIQIQTDKPENLPAFQELVHSLYPNVASLCEREILGGEMIYRLKGKSQKSASVLMAHYDVVPADGESGWLSSPFSGEIRDGKIWGRGTLDTKGTLCAALEAAESLLSEGFVPEGDIYFCFGGDEETAGNDARQAVGLLKQRGISPSFVLDEGGAIVRENVLGVKYPFALIGLAEKGYMDVELILRSRGGHTSMPPLINPTSVMAEAVKRLNANPFEFKMNDMSKALIKAVCKHSSYGYRFVFANYWLFRGFVRFLIRKVWRELDAVSRTTCAVTMLEGSPAPNMLPSTVRAVANIRIAYHSSCDETLRVIKKTVAGLGIEVNVLKSEEPSKMSVMDCDVFEKLKEAIFQTWGRTAIFPYLMMASSDARSFDEISDYVYRFSPIEMNRKSLGTIHGINESIGCAQFHKTVEFYMKLIKTL